MYEEDGSNYVEIKLFDNQKDHQHPLSSTQCLLGL